MHKITTSTKVMLDRWRIDVTNHAPAEQLHRPKVLKVNIITNKSLKFFIHFEQIYVISHNKPIDLYTIQVTLSENVHKFAELSQRIVVERSVTSQTTLSHSKTTEISSSHNISHILSTSMASSGDFNDRILAELSSTNLSNLTNSAIIPSDIKLTNYGSTDVELSDDGKTMTTSTSMNVTMSQVKRSNGSLTSLSPVKLTQSKSVDNLECSAKVCDVVIQRPLKVQTEMDFSVPYNIINNYFSVGVVSQKCYLFLNTDNLRSQYVLDMY